MTRWSLVGVTLAAILCATGWAQAQTYDYDLIVYGGTSGGVTAAVQAARMGKRVAIVDPGSYVGTENGTAQYVSHLGGLSSSGLGATDIGDGSTVGGVSYEFYRRLAQKNQIYSSWRFTPGHGETVFNEMVSESGVDVFPIEQLNRTAGVNKTGTTIHAISTKTGKTFAARQFIDATYEGDLMAAAGVSYTVGREARSQYNEDFNGVAYDQTREHIFGSTSVDPYVTPGVPASGLLPGVQESGQVAPNGSADHRIQAFGYRMTWTKASNRVKWTTLWGANGENPPAGYDRSNYELHDRYILAKNASLGTVVRLDKPVGDGKYDINNWGPVSTDFIGGNYDVYVPATGRTVNYAEANDVEREYIIDKHIEYTKGLLYYLRFDCSSSSIRSAMESWGLAADEFLDNGNFPHQIYVREARRMLGEYVMTEANTRDYNSPVDVPAGEEIGMGSYAMDSHNTHRYVRTDGTVECEGNFWLGSDTRTYSIAYGSITPQADEATNLLVIDAVSASHTAFGSMRMEPVYMVLGQSAATSAVLAMDEGVALQDIDRATYQKIMRMYGQKLTLSEPATTPYVGVLKESFSYGPVDGRLERMSYIAPGWADIWDASDVDPKYDASGNLSYGGFGYRNDTSIANSGAAGNGSGLRSGYIAERQIAGGMEGQIWLSSLLQLDANTGGNEALLWLDGGATTGVGLNEDGKLRVIYAGNEFGSATDPIFAAGSSHLLLGRVTLNEAGTADVLEIWLDPTLDDLGTADIVIGGADLFGDQLNFVGLSVGDLGGWIDAIRLSNQDTGFGDVLGLAPGDCNADGATGLSDLSILAGNYNMAGDWFDGDFNGDGTIGLSDLSMMAGSYGTTSSAIPEPATLALLTLGGMAALRRRI